MPDPKTGELRGDRNLKRLRRISDICTSGAFPILRGGDHSLGYPNERGSSVMTMKDVEELGVQKAAEMARLVACEGLCGKEVVEVSPPYDVNDNTSQLACRVILDVVGTMVSEGKFGHRNAVRSVEV